MSKDKNYDIADVVSKEKETCNTDDIVTDQSSGIEFDSIEKLGNYYKDKHKDEKAFKQTLKDVDVPISYRNMRVEQAFLMRQVNLLPTTDACLAIKDFMTLKIVHRMNNFQIALLYKEPLEIINIIEANAIKTIKDAIASQKGSIT